MHDRFSYLFFCKKQRYAFLRNQRMIRLRFLLLLCFRVSLFCEQVKYCIHHICVCYCSAPDAQPTIGLFSDYTSTSGSTGSSDNTVAAPTVQQTVRQLSSTSASKDIINPSAAE